MQKSILNRNTIRNLEVEDLTIANSLNVGGTPGGSSTVINNATVVDSTASLTSLNMNSQRIENVAAPVAPFDACNKQYADALANGLSCKAPVRVATTANGSLSSDFQAGSTVDGVTLTTGDRLLIKDQSSKTQNGIYIVSASGAPTRAPDADNTPGQEIGGGTFCFVNDGNANKGTGWVITDPAGPITIGSSNITFTQFSSLTYSADETTIHLQGMVLSIKDTYPGQSSINTLGTVTTGVWNATPITVAKGGTGAITAASARSNLGLGSMAEQSVPASGYVTSNGTGLSSVSSLPSTDISGLGSLATLDVPTSGYVKSDGSALSSVNKIPSSDITGLTIYDPSNVAITGGNARLSFLETSSGTHAEGVQHIGMLSGGNTRWALGLVGDEAGSNTGSNLALWGYSDAASWLRSGLTIERATGLVDFPQTTAATSHNLKWSAAGTTLGTLGYSGDGSTGYLNLTNEGDAYSGLSLRGTGHSMLVDGTFGIGSTVPTTRRLTLYPPYQVPGLQITSDTLDARGGLHLYTDRASQAIISGGGIYDAPAGGWIAGATDSSGIDMSNGQIGIWCNTGLTEDAGFSPNYSAQLTTAGLYIPTGKTITTPSITADTAVVNSGLTTAELTASSLTVTGRMDVTSTTLDADDLAATFKSVGAINDCVYHGSGTLLRAIGSAETSYLREVQGMINMQSGAAVGNAGVNAGWTFNSGGSGRVRIDFVHPFQLFANPVVTITPQWTNNAVGVTGKIVSLTNTTMTIATINTGTGADIGNDGTVDIVAHFRCISLT